MPIPAPPAVVVDHVDFAWPDGTPVLGDLCCTFPRARTGLIGPNGSGKSTLLRLVAGELTPARGRIRATGAVRLLGQDVAVDPAATVADLLGIAPVRRALAAVEAGSVDPADFETVGEDWSVEERALAELAALGLDAGLGLLDRGVTSLSGGQATQVALAGVRLARPGITLLDEPTNNLDGGSRRHLYAALDTWPGVLVVVSHDRELLEHVDAVVDLGRGAPTVYGGTYSEYAEHRRVLQEAAERDLRDAESAVKVAHREAVEEETKLARRARGGRAAAASNRYPPIVAGTKKRAAQATAGRLRGVHADRLAEAQESRSAADEAARTADSIRIDLPGTTVPAGRQVLALASGGRVLALAGPDRVRLTGANGAGKSTLLDLLLGRRVPHLAAVFGDDLRVVLAPTLPVGHLAQRTDHLDRYPDALEAVRAGAPGRTPHEARRLLARFLVTKDMPIQPMATLSGGERFRVALARTLFADPAPQLLVLDEPTNNLDMDSVERLVEALAGYRGALVVVTHDDHLARGLEVHRTWDVAPGPVGSAVVTETLA